MKYLGSKGRVIVGMTLIAILVLGVDSALGVTTISNTIISGVTAFVSGSADPAEAGVLRLGNTETICWEASPAGTDVCVQADANEDLLLDTAWNNVNLNSNPITNAVLGGSLNANGQAISSLLRVVSNAADPADTGVFRYGNTELICWEANPTGTDVCIQADASNDLLLDTAWNNVNLNSNPITNAVLGGSLNANSQTITSLASLATAGTPASAGAIRLNNAEDVCWRSSPSATDVCVQVDANEDILFGSNVNNINLNSNPLTNALLGGTLDGQTNIIQDFKSNTATKTTTATLTVDEETVLINAASVFTITLPASSGLAGKHYRLIKIDNGFPTTIDGNAAETINGAATTIMEHKYETVDLYSDGSNWFAIRILPQESRQYVIWEEDFTSASTDAPEAGMLAWFITGTNTETMVNLDPNDNNHVGVVRVGTSATAIGDDATLSFGTSATTGVFDFNAGFDITWIVRPSDTANIRARYGIAEDSSSANVEAQDNALFIHDSGTANWICRTRNAADQSTTSSVAVTLNQWYVLKIIRDGSTIRFFIDGTNVCNHSTEVPDEVATPAAVVDNLTTAAATIADIDYMLFIVRDVSR